MGTPSPRPCLGVFCRGSTPTTPPKGFHPLESRYANAPAFALGGLRPASSALRCSLHPIRICFGRVRPISSALRCNLHRVRTCLGELHPASSALRCSLHPIRICLGELHLPHLRCGAASTAPALASGNYTLPRCTAVHTSPHLHWLGRLCLASLHCGTHFTPSAFALGGTPCLICVAVQPPPHPHWLEGIAPCLICVAVQPPPHPHWLGRVAPYLICVAVQPSPRPHLPGGITPCLAALRCNLHRARICLGGLRPASLHCDAHFTASAFAWGNYTLPHCTAVQPSPHAHLLWGELPASLHCGAHFTAPAFAWGNYTLPHCTAMQPPPHLHWLGRLCPASLHCGTHFTASAQRCMSCCFRGFSYAHPAPRHAPHIPFPGARSCARERFFARPFAACPLPAGACVRLPLGFPKGIMPFGREPKPTAASGGCKEAEVLAFGWRLASQRAQTEPPKPEEGDSVPGGFQGQRPWQGAGVEPLQRPPPCKKKRTHTIGACAPASCCSRRS